MGASATPGPTGTVASLVPAAAAVGVVAVLASVIGGIVEGRPGVFGALLAGVVIVLFMGSTPVLLNPVARRSPTLSLPVAVLFFMFKAFAAMAVLLLLFDVGSVAQHVNRQVFGLAAVACALTWTALQIRIFRRARIVTYDLGE